MVERSPYSSQKIVLLCPRKDKVNTMGRGTGKSSVLVGDNMARRAVIAPYLVAAQNGLDRPVDFRGVLIGAVKEQAFELQNAIKNSFDRNAFLRSQLSMDTTKTNLVLVSGARILIRPATAAARGQHAQTSLRNKQVYKGIIAVLVDEGWFIRDSGFIREVISPMFNMAGKGSVFEINSTPYGKQGPVWDLYDDPRTGECLQRFVYDDHGRKQFDFTDMEGKFGPKGERIGFDRELCRECMRRFTRVKFNFPSYENPFANLRKMLEEKRALISSGRTALWNQEYLGRPESTAGMFFNETHQERMWNDELPEYTINDAGEFVRRFIAGDGEAEEERVRGLVPGDFCLGLDNNQGISTKRADFAAVCLIERRRDKKTPLRLCMRFRKAPSYFNGRSYEPGQVTEFLIDFAIFLVETFHIQGECKVFLDQGFGQALYIPLKQKFGEKLLEYVKTSVQDKMRALLHLRTMIELGLAQAPPIRFLQRETQYLQVEDDSLDDDKLRVHKAASWGTSGAEVDGVFAWAYAMRGTEDVRADLLWGGTSQATAAQVGESRFREPTRVFKASLN